MNKKLPQLSDQHLFFCNNYLLDFNVKEAARRCGISFNWAQQLLKRPEIKEFIDEKKAIIAEKCDVTAEQVLNEIKRVAFYDVKEHIQEANDSGVSLVPFEDMDGRAISEIQQKTTKDGITWAHVVPHRKLEALKILAEWFKDSKPKPHVHLHVTPEDISKMNAHEATAKYNELLND